jgi:LysR family glycine cleavage system transcriptional activator
LLLEKVTFSVGTMSTPSHLKSLQALELAVRTGSLKAAGEVLAISPAAVGQRVKALEDYLAVELLVRGRSGLKPTVALSGALEHLAAGFRELEAAAAVLELQRGHEIRIAALPDFADLWLKPRLAAFQADHPNIRFCINGEGDAPLRLGAVDCEIAFGPDVGPAELLFRDYVVPICSPENTARLAALDEADRPESFPLLHLDAYRNDPAPLGWSAWIGRHGLDRGAPERGLRFQRIAHVLEAVCANAGLANCGVALAADLIDQGQVSLPFPVGTGAWTGHGFTAKFRKDALGRLQVRRFHDWLLAESAATQAWLARFAGSDPA